VVVVSVVALLAGRKTIGRVFTAISAQFNKAGRAAISADPVAVYQKQVDDATEEIREGTKGLEQYRGLVSRLERQVEADSKEVAVWDARARGYVSQNNDTEAAKALTNKKAAEARLSENKGQLGTYDVAYKANLKKVKFAQDKINEAKLKAQKLQADLKMSKAEAEIANLAQSFNVNSNSLNKLGEIEEEIQRQIDTNRAKAQVVNDLGSDGLAEIEAEEAAREAAAATDLAKLKAEMGKV
jgi:phage shock protein A